MLVDVSLVMLAMMRLACSQDVITTIAGTGTGSLSGDGGVAISATLYRPQGVAIDALGNVYIDDRLNSRIRKITLSTGIITTIAGTGATTYNGDNIAATSATLWLPEGVAVDSSYNVYIADPSNNRIRKVSASTGVITTYAGTGIGTYSGDGGAATSYGLNYPRGVAVDSSVRQCIHR